MNCASWSITTIPSSAFVANALSSGYLDPRSTYRPTPAGIPISRDRVPNLMRRMWLRAIYQKPRTTAWGSVRAFSMPGGLDVFTALWMARLPMRSVLQPNPVPLVRS